MGVEHDSEINRRLYRHFIRLLPLSLSYLTCSRRSDYRAAHLRIPITYERGYLPFVIAASMPN